MTFILLLVFLHFNKFSPLCCLRWKRVNSYMDKTNWPLFCSYYRCFTSSKIWKESCCSLSNIDESDFCSEDSYLLCYKCKNRGLKRRTIMMIIPNFKNGTLKGAQEKLKLEDYQTFLISLWYMKNSHSKT